jgi:uncharacterized protein YutE (UPF0331/DUF86 family)
MIKKQELRKKEIEEKLSKTLELVEAIEEILPKEFGDFKINSIVRDAAYKRIESAIQNIIDICYMINSDLRLGTPEIEESIFVNLEKNKIFSKKFIEIIDEMKKFRNILIHRYGEINDSTAFENIKEGINDFELIIQEIEDFLKKQKIK